MGLSLSVWLLISAAICQAVLGYLGFHVSVAPILPEQKGRRRANELAFVSLAIVGVGCVVASGVQQSREQGDAIESFKTSQSAGFKEVKGEIQSIPNPQITVQPAPIVMPSRIPESPKHAAISIISFEVGHTKDAPSSDAFTFNSYIKNTGQIHGDSPSRVTYSAFRPDQLDDHSLAKLIDNVRRVAIKQGPPPYKSDRSQIDIADPPKYFSDFRTVSKDDSALFDSGKAWSYVIEALTYRDPNTGRGYWITEYCAARQPDGTINVCGEGNRTWLHK